MRCQTYIRAIVLAAVGLGPPASGVGALGQEADDEPLLQFVADRSDQESRNIAIGMSSLANSQLQSFDITIDWIGADDDPLERLRQKDADLGLLKLADIDPRQLSSNGDLRAVMKAWQAPDQGGESNVEDVQGYLLVARSTIRGSAIRSFLETVQSDKIVLKAVNLDVEKLGPSVSMIDLPVRLHEGAEDYLVTAGLTPDPSSSEADASVAADVVVDSEAETSDAAVEDVETTAALTGEGDAALDSEPAQTPIPAKQRGVRSYVLYFDSNDAALDKGDIRSIARACRYATDLPRAKFVISGHTDTAGSKAYNSDLAQRRADAVSNAIRNDPRFREALSVIELGESEPALATGDGVSEPLNRRVVITILPD